MLLPDCLLLFLLGGVIGQEILTLYIDDEANTFDRDMVYTMGKEDTSPYSLPLRRSNLSGWYGRKG